MRGAGAVGLLAAAAVVFGACGGSGGAATTGTSAASPGEQVFVDTGCGSCHILAAAKSTGTTGPKLDGRRYRAAAARRWVLKGGKGMPAYADQLTPAQVRDLTAFLVASTRGP